MKVLLTGGLGFIGSHIAVELVTANYEVIIGDNLSNSRIEVLDGIEAITSKKLLFENVDFSDLRETESFFKRHSGIDAIIHLAALKSVNESILYPELYYHNNISSISNLLRSAREYQIRKLVFSSSCTVYGNADKLPVTEDLPIKNATSPYGTTKIIGERLFDEYSHFNHAHSIILRYFNPIGAHSSGLIGELPLGKPNNLVPIINEVAAGEREYFQVFGSDYPTKDGTAIRDYIHVVDLAKAHVSALEKVSNPDSLQVEYFNIGTGKAYSVLEVLNTFEFVNNIKVPFQLAERREGDIDMIWADPTKAIQDLNWKAELGLEEMLQSAWNWKKNYRK